MARIIDGAQASRPPETIVSSDPPPSLVIDAGSCIPGCNGGQDLNDEPYIHPDIEEQKIVNEWWAARVTEQASAQMEADSA